MQREAIDRLEAVQVDERAANGWRVLLELVSDAAELTTAYLAGNPQAGPDAVAAIDELCDHVEQFSRDHVFEPGAEADLYACAKAFSDGMRDYMKPTKGSDHA